MTRLSKTDGEDHINIYSKGKTRLGVMLSNMSEFGFTHPLYGRFPSVESFWYFNKFRSRSNWKKKKRDSVLFEFRKLSGFGAKQRARELDPEIDTNDKFGGLSNHFKDEIKEALRCKVFQIPMIAGLLINSELPFRHYYVFDENDYEPAEYSWIPDYFEKLRGEIKKAEL